MIESLILLLLISMGIQYVLFIPAYFFQTDKLTDISYALTFIILAGLATNFSNIASIILFGAITIWAIRLGGFLFLRIHKMKRDKRFDAMRSKPIKFLGFWTIQGLTVFIVLLSSLFFLPNNYSINALFILGIILWLIGLMIETIADFQKYNFKQQGETGFIHKGLWNYSRHPNYFGEMLCWIGLYIAVLPTLNNYERFLAILSPVFIICLITLVSGIPILEKSADKKWGHLPKYKKYKQETSILIPWFK